MQVAIPYGHTQIMLDIPERCLVQVLSPKCVPGVTDLAAAIARSLATPIGTAPLEQLVIEKATLKNKPISELKLALICDDITRTTPSEPILEALISTLGNAGVRPSNMNVIVALGSHRRMTDTELRAKLGTVLEKGEVEVRQHDESRELIDLGMTANGVHVLLNRDVYEADIKIGVGGIVPHNLVGYGGGGKIILPGVTGAETTGQMHALYALDRSTDVGRVENPLRAAIEEVCDTIGLDFIVNTVQNDGDEVVGVFSGSFREAFRAGVALVREVYGMEAKQQTDIVIASSYPADIEFYQGNKGLHIGQRLVRDGGVLILLAPCYEGVARTHPLFKEYIHTPPEVLLEELKAGKMEDMASGSVAVRVGYVKQRITIALISEGVSQQDTEYMGFRYYPDAQAALQEAFEKYGAEATVTVLTHGGKSFPYFQEP